MVEERFKTIYELTAETWPEIRLFLLENDRRVRTANVYNHFYELRVEKPDKYKRLDFTSPYFSYTLEWILNNLVRWGVIGKAAGKVTLTETGIRKRTLPMPK